MSVAAIYGFIIGVATMAIIMIVLVRPYSWGCHYCRTWHRATRTARAGRKLVEQHEWEMHYDEKIQRRKASDG